MGWLDKLFGEFVDVIEWTDDSNDTMVYRFERYGNEIKYGAMLTVRETQLAVFVNEGEIADVFEPGLYELETANLPLLSTLQAWPHGFESPFKAEVYFFNTRRFVDLKWGLKNPLMLRDKEFGPVRLRAFGTYAVRVTDARRFLEEIVGTDSHFTLDEIVHQLRNIIVSRFAVILGESNIPVLELAAGYEQLGAYLRERLDPDFGQYGLGLTEIRVENVSLPPAVESALDERTKMGVIGDLDRYTKLKTAEALGEAASNPGGGAGEGIGLGIGFAMAQTIGEALSGEAKADTSGEKPEVPPPLPDPVTFHVAREGAPAGPYTLAEMRRQVESGELTAHSLVWKPGSPEWQTADSVPELQHLLNSSPPPIPGNAPQ